MSEKEIETSGTNKVLSIKVLLPSSFSGSELIENIEIDLTKNPLDNQHNKLQSILVDIITSPSGVDGTPTPEAK